MNNILPVFFSLLVPAMLWASQTIPRQLLNDYEKQARAESPDFAGFSPERGEALFRKSVQQADGLISCASCHTEDPRNPGKTRLGKKIEPLAPVTNPARFTDEQKVEKWFRRNCDDVFSRACTPQEKGDFITWLLTVQ